METVALAFSSTENNPVVRAFIQDRVKVPETFNVNIHPDDEQFTFILNGHGGDKNRALFEYLASGQEMLDRVRSIVNWKFNGFENVSSFLDFACGWGRLSRLMIQEFPADRIWVSDIYEQAVNFQKEQFGVNGVVSVSQPEEYPSEPKYNCILVASLFTHLPEITFIPWLQKLYSLLLPDGVLIFSVHDEVLMLPNLEMPESGLCFLTHSDSKLLSREEYGSTWVTESFVREAIDRVSEGKASYCRIKKGLWDHDLYVVVNNPQQDFSGLTIGFEPKGCLDDCISIGPEQLNLSGWAVSGSPGTWITDIQILINGRLVQRCMPFSPRPDVTQFLEDESGLISGWNCSCYLGEEIDFFNDVFMIKTITSNNIEQIIHISTIASSLTHKAASPARLPESDLLESLPESDLPESLPESNLPEGLPESDLPESLPESNLYDLKHQRSILARLVAAVKRVR